jgi:threonine/homoserine/homoserine lactone efflux protein
MTEILPPWPLLLTFLLASLVLAVTPGPAVMYIVTRSLARGRRAGLASVAGVALGNLGNVIAAAAGLAGLLAVSSVAFGVVKYAGAAYLIYLGLRVLRAGAPAMEPAAPAPGDVAALCRDGFLVALLNPKTTLFFAAFLPQFMGGEGQPVLQTILLGALFVAVAAVTDTGYAMAAGTAAVAVAGVGRARHLGRYLTGGAFIGLGLFTALAGARSGR